MSKAPLQSTLRNSLHKNLQSKATGPAVGSVQSNGKTTFDFKIAGVSYKIKTSHDQATVLALTDFVNRKVEDAIKITKNGSFQNAAVLAALNIAEELILLKRRALKEIENLEEKAQKLSLELEGSKARKDQIKSTRTALDQ